MTGPVASPPGSRPHARARAQLLLGLVPVVVVGAVLVVVLAVRLPAAQAPLVAATATAQATVVRDGLDPAGRGVQVVFDDSSGAERTGLLVLRSAVEVAADTPVTVQYDPDADDDRVHTDGDAAHDAVQDVLFGLVLATVVVLIVGGVTGRRLLSRPRTARRPTTTVTGTHLVVRQGLLVRSWLELGTARGERWLPVHWAPELDRMRPGTAITVHGDPATASLVLPVVGGQQLWPSGRLRTSAPRGEVRQAPVDPDAAALPLSRQVRGDVVVVALAPVLGLLWAYVDGSGPAGFVVASVLAAAVLFWLPQLFGSNPRAVGREQ